MADPVFEDRGAGGVSRWRSRAGMDRWFARPRVRQAQGKQRQSFIDGGRHLVRRREAMAH